MAVVPGFPGSGEATLHNHMLSKREGEHVVVIVNDMSQVKIDADFVRCGEAELSIAEEIPVEMSNGCICDTLRDDLMKEVRRLGANGRFVYLAIESTDSRHAGEP